MHTVIAAVHRLRVVRRALPGGLHRDGARGGDGGHLEVALPGVCAEATGKAGRLMLHKLFKFNGGVKPTTHKDESTREPIARLPLPRELVIPLHQSIGGTPRPLVQVGQQVLKGQRIGAADGNVSARCMPRPRAA
jgi:hypothetical protein